MEIDWSCMLGGYKISYDPRAAISELLSDSAQQRAWDELFENLHHQGDVGEASYASIPILVDKFRDNPRPWQFYCLISIVEAERHSDSNPVVPDWLYDSYTKSIRVSKQYAMIDMNNSNERDLIQSAMAVVALASGLVL